MSSARKNIWLSGGGWAGFETFLQESAAPSLLHIPLALDPQGERWATCETWMQETVAASDPSIAYTLQIVTDTDPELSPFSAIIITGGNTYRLLHLLRTSGLDKVLSQAICLGTPVYGVSAGAVVLGADIDTSVDKHPEYIASDGLDLIQGNSVLCHYADDRDEHLQGFLQTKRLPVIAIPDDETVRFDGERFYSALGDRMGRALWAQR